jgi:hypothetical protein
MSEEQDYPSSANYILRCAETIRADKNISEQTIITMFLEYGQLLLNENNIIPK